MTLHRLNDALDAHGLAMANLGDIDVQTISGAISTGTHGTGHALGGLATQVVGLELARRPTARWSRCSAERVAEDLRRGADRARGARRDHRGHAAVRAGLRAARGRGADAARGRARRLRGAGRGQRPLRVLLVPAHRAHADQAQQPGAGRASRCGRCRRVRGWVDDELLSNTVFGLTQRLTARVPRLTRRVNSVAARALSAREYVDASYRVFCSPRRVRFREMEYAVPRETLVDVLRSVAGLGRQQRRADPVPGRGAGRGRGRHLAVHGVRAGHGVRRGPPVPPAGPRAVLPRRRVDRRRRRRPAALGQAALPGRA